ncbi:signal transduction histidine kinase [Sphingobium jiangsuense]|uniref:histidine kinase n=1 Tax=Sphingobium jiangsuense TaxID=870476 RepID=A0A7W6BQL7_9SPHN|nr:response regulator [Sphingobium jiangsuense]MBB3926963.1 signal transduction histidine kinase/DNA-binding response OmpR family regulator [Sphingobium jiangsuense]GLT02521.1 signal transduction histidine kinase [Sphingobium jiangsuense]
MSPIRGAALNLLLYFALTCLLLLTFAADLYYPLGTAVWVVYLVPTVLAYLAPHMVAPVGFAIAASILTAIGYNYAPAGIEPEIALMNRSLAMLANLVLACIGVLFIRYRNAAREEQWLRDGEIALAAAVSGDLTPEEVAHRALAFLVQRLGARAGAIFAREEDGFPLLSAYGVPEGAIARRLAADDGLIGQAARDRRGFVITDVPDGYLTFGSALGRAKPRQVLIATGTADGEVNSVFELGFLAEPGARVKQAPLFMDRIGAMLGTALRSARYRDRLQLLLTETQQQAEELQVQSEELRASNDELETQTQNLLQAQAKLESQQAELQQINVQLEEQTRSLEMQRDELSRTQGALRRQAGELEQASRYKSEFLANMSHELRTPLNSLLIMARLLADNRRGNLDEEQIRFAETIETAGNDLLVLINDVLDISKIEAGQLEIDARPVPIRPLADKLLRGFGPMAQARGLRLRIDQADGLPPSIETDPVRLEQILKNFLSNAIKFTEQGEVCLRVASADDHVAFTVRDTGPGIAPEHHGAIFEAFRQADGSISRKYGGTGLGLSISRDLAHLLGGGITLESGLGEGSAFTLRLPLAFSGGEAPSARHDARGTGGEAAIAAISPPAAEAEPRAPFMDDDRETLSGDVRTILIVEDDPAFAAILRDLVHELGFQCLIAGTADEGALMARQYLPQAVILDLRLPDHSGLSVLDRIKRDMRTRHIPVHVVSVEDAAQAALSGGAVGYLLKPVARSALVEMLEGLESRMERRLRRVLVVEDDEQQATSMRHLLASRDVETVEVRTAAACLEKLGGGTFDCMVLDLNLPDMPGLDLLERLSTDDQTGFPPVIVYTGRDLSAEEELRLRRYSKSIIVKGAKSPERLLDEVTLFLHQVVSELPEPQRRMLAEALGRDAALEGRTVLLVEDDIRNIYALTSVFEPHGVAVRIARNGREALDELDKVARGEASPVHLVLMDVMMPEMDGLAATREIRRQHRWRDLPIIALTAKAMESDQRACLDAGVNDYLAKPLDITKLLSLARVWMSR